MTSPDTLAITCLGCGLLCDDVTLTLGAGGAVSMDPPCSVGVQWVGTIARGGGDGEPRPAPDAIAAVAAQCLAARGRLLVYLGPGLSIEALRSGIAIADRTTATVETATSEGAAAAIVAGQRRGRAAATLGELQNHADTVVFWGVDPQRTHPRFISRLVDRPGTHVPGGRDGRAVIEVRIGQDGGDVGADLSLHLSVGEELAALSVLRAVASGMPATSPGIEGLGPLLERITAGRYVVIVAGGETGDTRRHPQRAEGLVALAQALNGSARAALLTLRGGDNRPGVESILTWQSGYPFAVDYRSGAPSYRPDHRVVDDLSGIDLVLLLGDWRAMPEDAIAKFSGRGTILVGPAASAAPFATRVRIDTARLGIDEGGTAYRLDDIPVPIVPPRSGPPTAASVLAALDQAIIQGGTSQ